MINTTKETTLDVPPFVPDSDVLSSMRLDGGAKYWFNKRASDDALTMTDVLRELIDAYNARDQRVVEIVARIRQYGRGKAVKYVKQTKPAKHGKRSAQLP